MSLDLRTVFSYWESAGVFEIFLPFLLVFVLVFAILEKISMFGANKRGIHAIVALALGILVANNVYIREILHSFLPNIAFFLIIILAFLMLLGTFMGEGTFMQGKAVWIGVTISVIFVLLSLFSKNITDISDSPWLNWLTYMDTQTQAVIFFIAALLIFYLIATKGTGSSGTGGTGESGWWGPKPGGSS